MTKAEAQKLLVLVNEVEANVHNDRAPDKQNRILAALEKLKDMLEPKAWG